MTTNNDKQFIAAKMAEAITLIDAVTKSGRNQQQGYNYVKAADVANEVRTALSKIGIAFTYQVLEERHWVVERDGKSPWLFCSIRAEGTFYDSESGESVSSIAVGWGADTGDKAPYKAITGSLKYILRTTFLIPDETDPENDGDDHRETSRPTAAKPKTDTKPKTQLRTISKAQRDLLVSVAVEKGLSTATMKNKLGEYGFESSGEITADKYEEIVKWVKEQGEPG